MLIPGTCNFHQWHKMFYGTEKMYMQLMSYNSEELLSWLGLIIFIKKIINNPGDPLRGKRGLIWAPFIIPGLVFRTLLSLPSLAWTEGEGSGIPVYSLYSPCGGGGIKCKCDPHPLARERRSLGLCPHEAHPKNLGLDGTLEPWDNSGGLASKSSCVTCNK